MLVAALLFGLFTMASRPARTGALSGLQLLGELLIPSLLPFFTAAGLLNRLGFAHALGNLLTGTLGRLFGLSGCGCTVFLLGLSGGYPLGAATAADLCRSGQLSPEEARRLLRFCDNTGPSFALGAVGAAFGPTKAGVFLWLVHVLSALLTGLLLGRAKSAAGPPAPMPPVEESFAAAFTGAVQSAVKALLNIAGFVIFFSALLGILNDGGIPGRMALALSRITKPEERWWLCLLTGALELSSAVGQMQGMNCTPENLALGAFILSWGGLCIHFQSVAVLQGTGLNGKERLGGKLLQGVLSGILAYGFGFVFF